MRKPLIVANWKMNHTVKEALQFVTRLNKTLPSKGQVETVICPPFTSLYSLSVALTEPINIKLGAQNCYWEEKGAYTGEESTVFLKELNCDYVIVGHSERRALFGESDEDIRKKVRAVFENEMVPILCVGETEAQRKEGKTIQVVHEQLNKALEGLIAPFITKLVIAYEPVWAIGTGQNATPEQAQEVHKEIRDLLNTHFSEGETDEVRVLYGGSVKPGNISELMRKPDIDGALVGGASLEVDSFSEILNYQ